MGVLTMQWCLSAEEVYRTENREEREKKSRSCVAPMCDTPKCESGVILVLLSKKSVSNSQVTLEVEGIYLG